MLLRVSNEDIIAGSEFLNSCKPSEMVNGLKMLFACLRLEGGLVTLNLKVGPAPISIQAELRVVNGAICIDITQAKAAGLGLFGSVRKIAGDKMMEYLNVAPQFVQATRVDGNIHVTFTKVKVENVQAAGSVLQLTFTSNP
jgi:hypothetical protein